MSPRDALEGPEFLQAQNVREPGINIPRPNAPTLNQWIPIAPIYLYMYVITVMNPVLKRFILLSTPQALDLKHPQTIHDNNCLLNFLHSFLTNRN